MKTILRKSLIEALLIITVLTSFLPLQGKQISGQNRGTTQQNYNSITENSLCNIGNIAYWFQHNGMNARNPEQYYPGAFYPRGTAGVINTDGLVWGGITREEDQNKPQLRVGGNTFKNGTQPGWYSGDPNDPRARIYRIRKDWASLTKEDVRQDAAELNNVQPNAVTNSMLDEVFMQYKTDWKDWPVDLGAPYYDVDDNGIYNPVLDSTGMPIPAVYDGDGNLIEGGDYPGFADADQVLWFVINDNNESRVKSLYGSPTLGLEVQITVWAYHQPDHPTDQTVFKKYKIINKSGYTIDSMYIAQWSDPDLGDYDDDLVGCDSLLECAFVYNGSDTDREFDDYGVKPPAVGYLLLQGPVVSSPGDSAWHEGRIIYGYKNLHMTSFTYLGPALSWTDPAFGNYNGTLQWYNLLRGFAPTTDVENVTWFEHTTGPKQGQRTKFPLDGDPVKGTGDIDGVNEVPGERRLILSCGPFNLTNNDAQEIVIAVVGGQGPDHLSAINGMKKNMKQILKSYGPAGRKPKVSYNIQQPDSHTSQIFAEVNLTSFEQIADCKIKFHPQNGTESSFALQLYDDGLHEDRQAGDGYWAASITVSNKKYPFTGDIIISFESGREEIYENYISNLRLRPVPQLKNWRIIWENGKQDQKINHNETVHLQFDIYYPGSVQDIHNLSVTRKRTIVYNRRIPAGETIGEDSFYFIVLGAASGDSVKLDYTIEYDHHTVHVSTYQPVYAADQNDYWMDTVSVIPVVGTDENVAVFVADQTMLKSHTYAISFHKELSLSTEIVWDLTDLTTGSVILRNQSLAEDEYFPYPIVDGLLFQVKKVAETVASFELIKNSDGWLDPPASAAASWQGFPVPDPDYHLKPTMSNGSTWFVHTLPNGSYASFESFIERTFQYTGGKGNLDGTGIKHLLSRNYEIRFTGKGKAFDYWNTITVIDVPFELWDIGDLENQDDDYQLVPYLFDYDLNGRFNLMYDAVIPSYTTGWADHEVSNAQNDPWTDIIYWMHPVNNTPGSEGYENVIKALQNDPSQAATWYARAGSAPGDYDCWAGMQRMVLVNWNGGDVTTASGPSDYNAELPDSGSVFRIMMPKSNHVGDSLLVFSPLVSDSGKLPMKFQLKQNYPNPFNPLTTIEYALPKESKVILEIFNVLGQKVVTLVNAKQKAGIYLVEWNASKLASGLYIYRLKAGTFISSKKMLLVK